MVSSSPTLSMVIWAGVWLEGWSLLASIFLVLMAFASVEEEGPSVPSPRSHEEDNNGGLSSEAVLDVPL